MRAYDQKKDIYELKIKEACLFLAHLDVIKNKMNYDSCYTGTLVSFVQRDSKFGWLSIEL